MIVQSRRAGRRGLAWGLAWAAALAAGCGSGGVGKTVPVEGTVTLGGQPLKTGTITFHPDAAKGNTFKQLPVGTIQDGKYKLAVGAKDGAPPGWYKVTIESSVPSNPKDEYSEAKSVISEMFANPAVTTLTAEVKDGGGPYDFKVTK